MKKKTLIIITALVLLMTILSSGIYFYKAYRIAHATIKVQLVTPLEVEVYSPVKLKDFIKDINGKLEENFTIDTSELGKKTIEFSYINDEKIKVPYQFEINVVDKTPPIISMYDNYTLTLGTDENLEEEFFCGDNYDDHPICKIEGEYNPNVVGSYPVTFKATDSSQNTSSHDFTIHVTQKTNSQTTPPQRPVTTSFLEIVDRYKTPKTKIGIDISHWQGDIDFQRVKDAGVEFVFIRVGTQKGIKGEYYLDEKFVQNIEGFNKVGIPTGVYFYSYANSKKVAIKEANWVLQHIKNYEVSLPVVFDWENWSFYQEFHLSFYHLTEMANAFLDTVKKKGYQGMLYSSKNYLENIWMGTNHSVWLAHYTDKTNYEGKYQVWQLCSNGSVDGIDDNLVDIDVMYD